jgi:hypothetical protein
MGKLEALCAALCAAFCAAAAMFTAAALYAPAPVRSASGTTDSVTIPKSAPTVSEPGNAPAERAAPEPDYVLRSADGELCVFQGSRLLHRTGVYTRTLPREDQAHLEKGISADSQEALASLLEDLCS